MYDCYNRLVNVGVAHSGRAHDGEVAGSIPAANIYEASSSDLTGRALYAEYRGRRFKSYLAILIIQNCGRSHSA